MNPVPMETREQIVKLRAACPHLSYRVIGSRFGLSEGTVLKIVSQGFPARSPAKIIKRAAQRPSQRNE